ncbi:hypothetical protein SAMN05444156_0886 [Verrucomicrobium sp. GAS474]|uniref:hypothetical protein n=1 Tax=Verrucomicrobium sp. GAS474 TaxID=1882831 RepID=UPI00087C528B|nr:hypothetical protein [Verrucomicrobium sp. GAS474]SDT93614.1 hypothetical protein SAMN05444156_0886 [Verrucomicrobium sp. GAS474]
MAVPPLPVRCGNCVHFANAPAAMEEAMPGLATMSSGFGSVRAQDGLCALHGYYLAAWDRCGKFAERSAAPGRPAAPATPTTP